MLSQVDNDYVSRVGPGTPVGNLMREYWLPAMLSSELPHPDSDPVRVMLVGEQLIGFRDTSGRVGLLSNLCPHRGASLFYGRNEEDGLRCVYHGWKFDTSGSCVDMPNEPAESNFKARIKATAYPTQEAGGIVWAYLGPREMPPPFPHHEVLDLPSDQIDVGAGMRNCNWLQGLEGDLDTVHTAFLHGGSSKLEDQAPGSRGYYTALTRSAHLATLDTDYGCMYGAWRPAEPGQRFWLVAQFLFPFYAHIPGDRSIHLRTWVPMDDYHTMFYTLNRMPQDVSRRHDGSFINDPPCTLLPNTTDWYGRFRLEADAANDYRIDREAQRQNTNYTGIAGVFEQDHAVTESMGPILDRTIEHLGTSDLMIIQIRNRDSRAARALAEERETPPGVDDPDIYRTRPAQTVLPEQADWVEATEAVRAPA